KRLVDRPDFELALEGQVVPQLRVDDWRCGIECGFGIADRGQLLVIDLDQFGSVLGKGARARDDRAYGFPPPAGALDGERVLRRRLDALEVCEDADPRRDDLRKVRPGDHGYDARRLLRGLGADCENTCMGVRRAHKGDMRHARQYDIADEGSAPLRKPREVRPWHRSADIGVRPVERREAGCDVIGDFHCISPVRLRYDAALLSAYPHVPTQAGTCGGNLAPPHSTIPARACTTASTASMMAW